MFRRRRGEPEYVEDDEAGWEDDEETSEAGEAEEEPQPIRAGGGPWDAGEPVPGRDRVDLGSLRVPVGPGHEIQLVMAEQQGAWVTARYGESEIQVQAFAAARNDALWDDVRDEIAAEIQAAGGRSWESEGLFGTELGAEVPVEPGDPAAGLRTVRFIGVDGPRWFLRGLLSGPAATGGGDADVLEDVFRDIVVVRGDHPVPPRDLLELRLPPEAAEAIAEQQAQQARQEGRDWGDANPFDRGPEFTETRLSRGNARFSPGVTTSPGPPPASLPPQFHRPEGPRPPWPDDRALATTRPEATRPAPTRSPARSPAPQPPLRAPPRRRAPASRPCLIHHARPAAMPALQPPVPHPSPIRPGNHFPLTSSTYSRPTFQDLPGLTPSAGGPGHAAYGGATDWRNNVDGYPPKSGG